jgi:hypothetical protein
MVFDALVVLAALAGGAVAGVTGFGIGSLLTPALAWRLDTGLAVAAVSVPHLIGTGFRYWLLGGRADHRGLWTFGVTSAIGGLAGAMLQARATSPWLLVIFGGLLLFTAGAEISGLAQRMVFRGGAARIAGAVSGVLGGLVGNQGGIRSAALLGVEHLPKETFVATTTAVGLMVDVARVPVYVWRLHESLRAVTTWIALAVGGVVVGTIVGHRLLARIPERLFRRTVAVLLGVLGATMLIGAVRQ